MKLSATPYMVRRGALSNLKFRDGIQATVILRQSVRQPYSDYLLFNQQMLLQPQSHVVVQLLEQPLLLLLPQQNQSTRRMMIIQQQLPPLPKLNPQFIEISPLNNVF